MISELKIRNFKSLESVDLKLGHFNLLVGANASGKSNFLDALRFLQGVGNGFSIDEILNGKPPTATSSKWDGIRGGSTLAALRQKNGMPASRIDFDVWFEPVSYLGVKKSGLHFQTNFSIANPISWSERFFFGRQVWYEDSNSAPLRANAHGGSSRFIRYEVPVSAFRKFAADTGESQQLFSDQHVSIGMMFLLLADMQFLDPLPSALRGYSSRVERMTENGGGFAALIREIETNGSKPALLEWLKELRPDEVSDMYALSGADNDFMVAIKEGNTEFRAAAISEGTLRFIALAAAFFQPSMPKVLVIEEIEKGLHPSRLRLLLELMRSQSKRTGTQVFATTHSPTLLAWLTEDDRKTTFVCTRDAESGATKMRSLAEIPRFEELIQEGSRIDELFAEGWLESAPQ